MRHYIDLTERAMITEVVLAIPIETVLAPYLARAPSDAVKKWLSSNFRNWLVKTPENLKKLTYLPPNADEKQKKAFEFDDLYEVRLSQKAQNMVEHIMDFFADKANQNLPRLDRMSVDDVMKAANQWVERMNDKAMKQPDDPTQAETVMEFPGGFRMVSLVGRDGLNREGALMGHCVGGDHHCALVLDAKSHKIYSLRDANNEPRATIEVRNDNKRTTEIKGRGNKAPVRRYWPMLRQFVEEYGINVDNDHANIGLLKIQDPASGEWQSMSVEDFKDLVLDPSNERGKEILDKYGSHGGSHDTDTTIGLFNALYGSDRMTDRLVKTAFEQSTDHALQTVQHHGNKLTPDQLVIAFGAMKPSGWGNDDSDLKNSYREMLQVAKPDEIIVKQILDALSGNGGARRGGERDVQFVAALSQALPDTYAKVLIDSGPEVLQNELEQPNSRAAGPYFVYMTRGGLTPQMVENAFHYMGKDALKRARREKYVFSPELLEAGYLGLSRQYWSSRSADSEQVTVLNGLTEYAKPDKTVLKGIFDELQKNASKRGDTEFAAKLLLVCKKHVPESLDKGTVEKAVMAIDSDEMWQDYLEGEPTPPPDIQDVLWKKATRENGNIKFLRWMRSIDPKFFAEATKKLKAEPVSPTKREYKNVVDKKTKKSKQINMQVKKTDDEMAKDRSASRHSAIRRFLGILKPMLQEPRVEDGETDDEALDRNSPKFKAGQHAFQAMGKLPLFTTAINALERKGLISKATGSTSYGRGVGSVGDFLKSLDRLSPQNIAGIIDNAGYGNERMRDLINQRPDLVPAVLIQPGRNGNTGDRVGKLDWKGLDKERTFDALEAVWASPKVPDGFKDSFTLAVFKRFKPSPARLMSMLDKADNEDATKYVLKKTKKPSLELLRFVLDGWPHLLLDAQNIPDEMLKDVFEKNMNLAHHLMNKNLRGYGSDSRSKWADNKFRQKVDPESEEFKKYESAAKAAGKEKEFYRYTRQSELDDSKEQYFDKGKVDLAKVAEHLDEFSGNTLVHIAGRDDSGAVAQLMFDRFEPRKLAALIKRGVFQPSDSYHNTPRADVVAKVDPAKLREAIVIALATEKKGSSSSGLTRTLDAMVKNDFPFDDELKIAVLSSADLSGYESKAVKNSLIGDNPSDTIKDYVAEHLPQEMGNIKTPNEAMVAALFDQYAKISKGHGKKAHTVNYFFTSITKSWFNGNAERVWFKWQDNPVAYKLLKQEAVRRGGVAAKIALATFKSLAKMKQESQKEDNHYYSGSSDDAGISMLPRGYKPER